MVSRHATSLVCMLLFSFSLSNRLVAQEKSNNNDATVVQDSQAKKTRMNKKPPQPFQWVNQLSKSESRLPNLKHATFESPSLQVEVGYCIYLPKEYAAKENVEKRYPVVYYLHGGRPGSERKSIRLVRHIDQHISSGSVSPMIYVFVNGGSGKPLQHA